MQLLTKCLLITNEKIITPQQGSLTDPTFTRQSKLTSAILGQTDLVHWEKYNILLLLYSWQKCITWVYSWTSNWTYKNINTIWGNLGLWALHRCGTFTVQSRLHLKFGRTDDSSEPEQDLFVSPCLSKAFPGNLRGTAAHPFPNNPRLLLLVSHPPFPTEAWRP